MNKVIDYNYYLNLSNQLFLNYFRWSHDNNVFFLILGPSITLEKAKQGTSKLVHKLIMASFNRQMINTPNGVRSGLFMWPSF